MATPKIKPRMLFADANGKIYDHPELLLLCRRGTEFGPPRPDEITPLPEESELFLLPGRRAVGLDPETGAVEALEENAVAAFVCPGYTSTGLAAYLTDKKPNTPTLPLFAYTAVGYAAGRLWVCAKKVDEDPRQIFKGVSQRRIQDGAQDWLKRFPKNRLVKHLMHCALTSCCPAARNLCLGRFEAPLPTARTCNAACVGCLSLQPKDSGFPSTQSRLAFAPDAREIVEIMLRHAEREPKPVFSFGQGCEGEPLTEAPTIAEAIRRFRAAGGKGTVNINTNASLPDRIPLLAEAGLNAVRVSLNSARPAFYSAYYRPKGYAFEDVRGAIVAAKESSLYVCLNFLFFPGVSDTEEELEALSELIANTRVDFVQLRNLNLDPELYLKTLAQAEGSPPLGASMGFLNFKKRLRKSFPDLGFGYFNPYVGG
jgi:pyruvate-formate lyase-activating enzyme